MVISVIAQTYAAPFPVIFVRGMRSFPRLTTQVKKVDREEKDGTFSIQIQRSAYVDGETWYYDDTIGTDAGPVIDVACKVIVMANGLWVPNKVPLEGIELATGYEELPSSGESFENQAVTVLGMGNAALETANAMVSVRTMSLTVMLRRAESSM